MTPVTIKFEAMVSTVKVARTSQYETRRSRDYLQFELGLSTSMIAKGVPRT